MSNRNDDPGSTLVAGPALQTEPPTRRKTLASLITVALAVLGLTLGLATPALASAHRCVGDVFASCIDVRGSGLHVTSFGGTVTVGPNRCIHGHSQVLINGAHYADSNGGSDADYCARHPWADERTTGTWNVNRNYSKGTRICAKFWAYTGNGPVNGYKSLGTACVTVG